MPGGQTADEPAQAALADPAPWALAGAYGRWDVGVAHSTAPGEHVSGDASRVLDLGACLLVCLADGLGQGPAAREASEAFAAFAERHSHLTLTQILAAGGRALSDTRGASAMLLRLGHGSAEVAGIGTVALRAWTRRPFAPLPTPGILGGRHASPRGFTCRVAPGDLFVLSTDGVSRAFLDPPPQRLPAPALARALLSAARTTYGDATVVAVRVVA